MANEEDLGEVVEREDPAQFEEAKEKLRKRCESAHIKCADELAWNEITKILSINLPCGREAYRILIDKTQKADLLLSIPFEKYCMMGEYVGICSYSCGTIEASVRSVGIGAPMSYLMRKLLSPPRSTEDTVETISPLVFQQDTTPDSLSLRIGTPSEVFTAFQAVCPGWRSTMTLALSNSGVKTHDKALRLLERIANSFFFQIELNLGVSLSLQRERRRHRIPSSDRQGSRDNLTFPKREYDTQPMSLFWYAKSASGMPLLQFLAYYQVLEFYMPTYSNHEAIGKVRNILKDPRFNPDTDSQVSRILASLRSSGRGFGDERSQLEAVIRRCIAPQDLREFYTGDDATRNYYEKEYKNVTPFKIPLQNENSDLISETAQRLYEIRCRIVHTKDASDRDLPALLPYSRESGELYFDNALIETIATAALIASSIPLKTE
jgi:hypothetical protein